MNVALARSVNSPTISIPRSLRSKPVFGADSILKWLEVLVFCALPLIKSASRDVEMLSPFSSSWFISFELFSAFLESSVLSVFSIFSVGFCC